MDCSANATPEFEGRGGQALADSLSSTLGRAYNTFDTRCLCLLKGSQCWVLYVDILILECGGNLSDAVSMAVKAALYTTLVPKVIVCMYVNANTLCVAQSINSKHSGPAWSSD